MQRLCRYILADQDCPRGPDCQFSHQCKRCSCGLGVPLSAYDAHRRGKRHQRAMDRLADEHLGGREDPPEQQPQSQYCSRCRKHVAAAEFTAHIERHQRHQRVKTLLHELEGTEQDQKGVSVSHPEGIDFGIVEEGAEGQVLEVRVSKDDGSRMALDDFILASALMEEEARFTVTLQGAERWLKSRRNRTVTIHFHPSFAGHYEDRIHFVFFHWQDRKRFVITRRVMATVGSKEDHELLKPQAPYVKRQRTYVPFEGKVVRTLRPDIWTPTKWKGFLPKFEVPKDLAQAALTSRGRSLAPVRKFLPGVFNWKTYGQYFQVLLHVEETEQAQNLDAYSLTDVAITPRHPKYTLEVKGLEEGRPSVLVGDFILVKHSNSVDDTWYQGCVQNVRYRDVDLRFNDNFSTYRGTKFDVKFVLNRLSLRRMHAALTNKNKPKRLLFPDATHLKTTTRPSRQQLSDIHPFNRRIGEDEEQLEVVAAILNRKPGDVPFIVFGPPGTGKTVTIVESIRQVLDRDPNARVLACAPSNSAADHLAISLRDLGPKQLLRLNSLTRRVQDLPSSLKDFAFINGNQVFAIPSLEEVRKYRVVVSTCITGGVPSGLGIRGGHYSHIFVDEAGQAKEPELMIPLLTMADKSTTVVLAGDPRQLGPIVHSSAAGQLGLKKSYLSRLMELDIYSLSPDCPAGGRGITVVKLVKNFRSHPAILQFSNEHFYQGELRPCGARALTHSLENYEELPKRRFPIIFHGIIGRDQRENFSPSFFNIDEVSQVKRYCHSLIGNRKLGVSAKDIMIIAPYHAQVMKIRDILGRDTKTKDIEVGSVEEFQGQERRIVILSTVRSSTQHMVSDVRRALGFVASPHRLNVALTRAQALLIVIGNPVILALDPLWRAFLNFVYTQGGWTGSRPTWNWEDEVDFTNASYDTTLQERALGAGEEMMARLKALIVKESSVEFPLVEEEESDDEPGHEDRPVFRRDAE